MFTNVKKLLCVCFNTLTYYTRQNNNIVISAYLSFRMIKLYIFLVMMLNNINRITMLIVNTRKQVFVYVMFNIKLG